MSERVCAKTGLTLTMSPARALRIARESFGPLDPRLRRPGGDPAGWSRYDTIGRTIYASADKLTAYMELLSPYRTEINSARRALQKDADFIGVSLDELWNKVVAEWDEAGNMKARWLPRAFRAGRALYNLSFPAGWWVDVSTTETINAINTQFSGALPLSDEAIAEPFTLSQLTSDDRVLTTAIASWLREDVVLDDGSRPIGVRFISKHGRPTDGAGTCWAYWMREVDHGLPEPTTIIDSTPIEEDDFDLKAAQRHCNITLR